MDDFPCANCITLARCKTRVMSSEIDSVQFQNVIAHSVMCPLLESFIKGVADRYDPDAYIKAQYTLKFFRGEPLELSSETPSSKNLIEFFKRITLTMLKKGKVKIGACHEIENEEV